MARGSPRLGLGFGFGFGFGLGLGLGLDPNPTPNPNQAQKMEITELLGGLPAQLHSLSVARRSEVPGT